MDVSEEAAEESDLYDELDVTEVCVWGGERRTCHPNGRDLRFNSANTMARRRHILPGFDNDRYSRSADIVQAIVDGSDEKGVSMR